MEKWIKNNKEYRFEIVEKTQTPACSLTVSSVIAFLKPFETFSDSPIFLPIFLHPPIFPPTKRRRSRHSRY